MTQESRIKFIIAFINPEEKAKLIAPRLGLLSSLSLGENWGRWEEFSMQPPAMSHNDSGFAKTKGGQ